MKKNFRFILIKFLFIKKFIFKNLPLNHPYIRVKPTLSIISQFPWNEIAPFRTAQHAPAEHNKQTKPHTTTATSTTTTTATIFTEFSMLPKTRAGRAECKWLWWSSWTVKSLPPTTLHQQLYALAILHREVSPRPRQRRTRASLLNSLAYLDPNFRRSIIKAQNMMAASTAIGSSATKAGGRQADGSSEGLEVRQSAVELFA